jgi:hypothetical protein
MSASDAEILLTHIDALAAAISVSYDDLCPQAKSNALELAHALSALRIQLLNRPLIEQPMSLVPPSAICHLPFAINS